MRVLASNFCTSDSVVLPPCIIPPVPPATPCNSDVLPIKHKYISSHSSFTGSRWHLRQPKPSVSSVKLFYWFFHLGGLCCHAFTHSRRD